MKKSFVFSVLLVAFVGLSFLACGGGNDDKNDACDITSFKVDGDEWFANGAIVKIFPKGTLVNNLTPTIVHTGVSIDPPSGIAQDFTNLVTYTVTAASGKTRIYTVKVTVTQEK
jgi:hypothetical protein